MKNINDFLLTDTVTVGHARKWISDKDDKAKKELSDLINHRFYNRYVKHAKPYQVSGFLRMAIACLMIETLESFKQGVKNTKPRGVGLQMFTDFFASESSFFPGFNAIAGDFYSSIRCGILHQAETTNGWRILRVGPLLDLPARTINAKKFIDALEEVLNNYVANLQHEDFSSILWKNAVIKIADVCDNCQPAGT